MELGFADTFIAELVGTTAKVIKELRKKYDIHPSFKMVDTCAAEFDAQTPYYYSTYDGENEAIIEDNGKKKVLVLGLAPIRIGPKHGVRLLLRPFRVGLKGWNLRLSSSTTTGDCLH